jgi:hypothetical protein
MMMTEMLAAWTPPSSVHGRIHSGFCHHHLTSREYLLAFSALMTLLFTFPVIAELQPEESFDFDNFESTNETQEVDEFFFSAALYHNPDLYYSNIGFLINLTDEPIHDMGKSNEWQVYKQLFTTSYLPRFALLELSVYPMPVFGTWFQKNQTELYDQGNIKQDFNLIESITAGFDEPFAISLFLNNMVVFNKTQTQKEANVGFMGYLFSSGTYHIRDNQLIDDQWFEIEWKLKGDKRSSEEILSWSFRLGTKFHSHSDISDILFLALRRKKIDFKKTWLSFLDNVGTELVYQMRQSDYESVETQFFIDKKFPFKRWKAVFSLGIGVINEGVSKYSGALRKDHKDIVFLLRPNIEF